MDRKSFLNTLIAPKAAAKRHASKEEPPETKVQKEPKPDTPLYLQSGINPYSGNWTTNERIHLLKRLSFGAVKEDVDYFSTLTYEQAVDEMLNTKNTSVGFPIKTYTSNTVSTPASDPDWAVGVGETWINVPTSSGTINSLRGSSLKNWWLNLMINQPRSVEEKMVLFLSTHLAIEFDTVAHGVIMHKYLNTLRTHALGNYKQLIKAITIDPAMLIYLNGRNNNKTAPDENYARELQELFTVGKGPGSGYTEADVKAAAKVLTGYTVNTTTATSAFDPNRHDGATSKQFSAFYNNKVIAGQTGVNGQNEVDELINMIFATDEVAMYICRRIYRFFVYGNLDSTIEANVITPLAAIFRSNNYELKPVLSALFKSEHFFDVLTQGAMIKSPVDFLVGMQREFKMKLPAPTNPVMQYKFLGFLTGILSTFNQNLGDPPNVSGWQAYYQEPLYDKSWLDTDSYTKRRNFISQMINPGYTNTNQKLQIDPISIAKRMTNPADPNELIEDFTIYFLRMPLSDTSKAQIKKDTLLTGQTSDHYWTDAWNNYMANPNLVSNVTEVNTRLRTLCNYFLFLEEYHLM